MTRVRSSRGSRRCWRTGLPPASRGPPSSARASGARRVPRTRATRRRCSASPTRPCTTRSGTAPCCASSRARSHSPRSRSPTIGPCVGSTEHGKERRCRLSRRRSGTVQKVVLSELDSGERIISERVPSVRSVSLGFWIDVGSRDERADRAGVSHFLEHLLFKGTRRFDAQEIAETFDAMGAELNAATSRENTVVYARVPDHHVETALEVMTDMVFAPSFAEVDQERDVVLEEIAMYEDTPQELVHDLFSQAVFGDHPLGRPVIGTAEVISSVSRRALSGYHRTAYAVYSFGAQYTDTGVVGVYVGTREENLGPCVEICVEQIAEIAAGRLRKGELERAKESLKGRIVLSLESTSNRMSRLGKSLVTDTELLTIERVMAEIDAVDGDELAELATALLPPERLAAAGVGSDEAHFRSAVSRASSSLVGQAAARRSRPSVSKARSGARLRRGPTRPGR